MDVKGSKAQGGNEDDAMLFDRIARSVQFNSTGNKKSEKSAEKRKSEKGPTETAFSEAPRQTPGGHGGDPSLAGSVWRDWFRRSGELVHSNPKVFPDYWALTVHMCDTTFSWYICV